MKKIILSLLLLFNILLLFGQNKPCLLRINPMDIHNHDGGDKYKIKIWITNSNNKEIELCQDWDGDNDTILYYFNNPPIGIKCKAYKRKKDKDDEEFEIGNLGTNELNYHFESTTNGYVRATLDFSISPLNFRFDGFYSDRFCLGKDINFSWDLPLTENDVFYFCKNNSNIPFTYINGDSTNITISSNSFILSDDDYYKQIPITIKATVIENSREPKSKITLSANANAPKFWKNVEDKNLYVVDDTLYFDELKSNQKIVLGSTLQGQFEPIYSGNKFKLGNYYGEYNIEISETNKCPISKTLIYPEIIYNKVYNDYNFWYPSESRDCIDLNFKYTNNSNDGNLKNIHKLNFDFTGTDVKYKFEDTLPGKVLVQDKTLGTKVDTVDCLQTVYTLNSNQNLKKIDIQFADYVPVSKHINLKSCPYISASFDTIITPLCYYDTAKIYFKNVTGGLNLKSGYEYLLSNGDKTLIFDELPLTFTKQDFNLGINDNHLSLNLEIFDAEMLLDDTGYNKRMYEYNQIPIDFPVTPQVLKVDTHNLLCHNDNSGSIEITDFKPKNASFEIQRVDINNQEVLNTRFAKNLSAGLYHINIYDVNKCINSNFENIVIAQPDTIKIDENSIDLIWPHCFGYANGAIHYDVSGGTGLFNYSWSNGDINQNLDSVVAGDYSVTITDFNNCKISRDFTLLQPEKLTNNVSQDLTICKDASFPISSEPFDKYIWTKNNQIVSNNQTFIFSQDGKYILTAFDKDDCYVVDTVNINLSNYSFDKCLLVASEGYMYDTLVLINNYKSDKNDLFKYSFEFYPNNFNLIDSSEYFYKVLPLKGGNHLIKMNIYGPDCIAREEREIFINNGIRPENYEQSIIENTDNFVDIKMGPNPSDGNFNLDIVLSEDADLEMRLYSISNPKLLKTEKYHGDNKYYISCNDGLNPGQYLLMLKSKGQTKVMKFMVTK